jgi:hypothetical protein
MAQATAPLFDSTASWQLGLPPARPLSVISLPAQLIDATQALNLSAGVSNCKVSRGRSLS